MDVAMDVEPTMKWSALLPVVAADAVLGATDEPTDEACVAPLASPSDVAASLTMRTNHHALSTIGTGTVRMPVQRPMIEKPQLGSRSWR